MSKIRVAMSWPIGFLIDPLEPTYFVINMDVEPEQEMEVSRQVWCDMLAARRTDATDSIARALDPWSEVVGGDLPPIAKSLGIIAAHSCQHGEEDIFAEHKTEEEPS